MRRPLLLTAVTLAFVASPAFGAPAPTAGCEVIHYQADGKKVVTPAKGKAASTDGAAHDASHGTVTRRTASGVSTSSYARSSSSGSASASSSTQTDADGRITTVTRNDSGCTVTIDDRSRR